MMDVLKKICRTIADAERAICCVLLVVMLTICFLSVIMRYGFGNPIVWSEEIILTCLIWFGFLCISIGVEADGHVAIEGFFNMLPDGAKRALDLLRHGIIVIIGLLMLYFGFQVFRINLVKRLPASKLPQAIQYLPMVVGGVLCAFFSTVNLLSAVVSGKGGRKDE